MMEPRLAGLHLCRGLCLGLYRGLYPGPGPPRLDRPEVPEGQLARPPG